MLIRLRYALIPSGMGTISTRYVFYKSAVVVERLRRNDNATVFCLTALFAVVAVAAGVGVGVVVVVWWWWWWL